MRKIRICAGALALLLALGTVGGALGEIAARRGNAPALYRRAGEGLCGNWWGALYEDALLLTRAEDEEAAPKGEKALPEEGPEVIFVWPLWDWLLRFLGVK